MSFTHGKGGGNVRKGEQTPRNILQRTLICVRVGTGKKGRFELIKPASAAISRGTVTPKARVAAEPARRRNLERENMAGDGSVHEVERTSGEEKEKV